MHKMDELTMLGIRTLEMDVTNDQSVRAGVSKIAQEAGHLDVLVNNAGVGATGPLAELPLAEVAHTMNVNVLGALRLVQEVVPIMVDNGGGTIVNVASIVAWAPTPWAGAYCASKAAIQALTHTLRVELRPFNIHTMLVCPGSIQSNLGNSNSVRLSQHRWSLYAPYASSILERATASQTSSATPAHLLAHRVVQASLSSQPPTHLAFGYMTTLFHLLSWSPLWLRDLFMSIRFGLPRTSTSQDPACKPLSKKDT
ncbi:hypothetical protein GOP47_0002575 [Adiantum capillus-veneris]|uniref:Uncharacterized protein n=1 Tax=Adiantum capillus-veneris TaxID=13818 RepID=A0A9D4VAX5_ADICA|nr:hypothetical protein GOP47_0002575 [Adiantum capillus-veneris]